MKKWILVCVLCTRCLAASSQSHEAEQLLLNVEKLTQLKSILTDMEKGYTIVSQGYNSIKEIAQGNFSLHQTFIEGLLLVNPEIKKYRRIAEIISCQRAVNRIYKASLKHLKSDGNFSAGEVAYIGKVYRQLFSKSLDNLDQLTLVITDSKLGMTDEERLRSIDLIFANALQGLEFLQHFNRQLSTLEFQRKKEIKGVQSMQKYFIPLR
jgi:hypothetical protein